MISANVLKRFIFMTGEETRQNIRIEVVYATPERQELVTLDMCDGSTLADAIAGSGLAEMFDNFEVDPSRVGIFGQKSTLDQVLRNGDRVEIYRPLIADPKEVRRQRALTQAKS
jgi:putative ubiquitin-RnfH superfamily antitoxin RatB of RatAB toxin-antitoxin module